MRRVAPVVVGLAAAVACGRLGFDGAGRDSGPPPDDAPACQPGANPTSFDGGCMPWGLGSGGNATITSDGGRLVITPAPGLSSFGSCRSVEPLAFASGPGAWVAVEAVLDPGVTSAFTAFALDDQVNNLGLELEVIANELRASAGPFGSMTLLVQSPWTPAMTWWRWRASGADSIAEFSSDGRTWMTFATAVGLVPDQVQPFVSAGHGPGQPAAGSAIFAGFNECPP